MNSLVLFMFAFPVVLSKTLNCYCGKEKVDHRSIDARRQLASQPDPVYPWMAGLILKESPNYVNCWASLLNSRYLLTAGHCVANGLIENITDIGVTLGVNHVSQITNFHSIDKIILHPNATLRVENDIALVKLTKEVTFSDRIKPVCLPSKGDNFSDDEYLVVGWTPNKNQNEKRLQETWVQHLADDLCVKLYGKIFSYTENNFCAGESEDDLCYGNPGGLLMGRLNGNYYQVGIASYGSSKRCQQLVDPTVYTKLENYLDWIRANTRDSDDCQIMT